MTPRTLGNWKRAALGGEIPLGRPRRPERVCRRALWAVARQMRRQGDPGWRPVARALPGLAVDLVQECVRAVKARRRKHAGMERRVHRTSVRVLYKNVILGQDGTLLGRMGLRPVEAQVVRDPATLLMVLVSLGIPATAQDVLTHLEAIRLSSGLPLVWQTDNGSIYCAQEVQDYLQRHQVVHLRNLPRTPQHNAVVERGIGELKQVSGLGKGVQLASVEEAAGRMQDACRALDARPRQSRGWKTALELDACMPMGYNVSRAGFYAAVQERRKQAVLGASSARQARLLEREAVYAVLEEFGLVSRLKGGRPIHPV